MFVLLKRGIYEVRRSDGLRWHNKHTKFRDHLFRHLSNIKHVTAPIWEAAVLVLLKVVIYELRFEMTCVPSFMKSGTGVHAILRFCLNSLRSCNVGNTDGRDLWSSLVRWAQVAWYTYRVSWRSVQSFSLRGWSVDRKIDLKYGVLLYNLLRSKFIKNNWFTDWLTTWNRVLERLVVVQLSRNSYGIITQPSTQQIHNK
jgi:hypothetical protein